MLLRRPLEAVGRSCGELWLVVNRTASVSLHDIAVISGRPRYMLETIRKTCN